MTRLQLTQFTDQLKLLKTDLESKGRAPIEPNRTSVGEVGGDQDEQPLNEMLQTIASNRNRNLGALIVRVESALTKIEKTPGEFGVCEGCEEQISAARLKAMPYVMLCVLCQTKQDGTKTNAKRKSLTDYL